MGLGRWFSSFSFSFLNTGFLCVALPARAKGVLHYRRPASHTLLEEDTVPILGGSQLPASSIPGVYLNSHRRVCAHTHTHTKINHTHIKINPGTGEIVKW